MFNGDSRLRILRQGLLLMAAALLWTAAPCHVAAASGNNNPYFPFSGELFGDGGNSADAREWRALDERVAQIESRLAGEASRDEQQLLLWQRETAALSESVSAYAELMQTELQRLNSELQTLGEPGADEPDAIADQRSRIGERKAELEGKLAGYRLLLLHSDTLHRTLIEQRQRMLTERFFARGPSSPTLLAQEEGLLLRWPAAAWQFLSRQSGLEMLGGGQLLLLAALLLAAALAGLSLRRRCLRWCGEEHNASYRYAIMLLAAMGHYAPHLLAAAVTAGFSWIVFSSAAKPFVFYLGVTLPLFFLGWALLHFLFRGKGAVSALFSLPVKTARGLGRSLKLFVLFAYAGVLSFTTGMVQLMPEPQRFLLGDVLVVLVVLTLLWTLFHLRRVMQEHRIRGVFGMVLLLLLGALVAELAGYRNFSYWVLRASVGTTGLLFSAWLLTHLLGEFFEGLRAGQLWWQRGMRRMLGYGADESMPWLGWIRLLAVAAIWLGFVYSSMLVWGISPETIKELSRYALEGFQIGSLTVVPARIIVALLVFALLLALSGWLRGRLEDRWLASSRMERGSREALVTISGYLGVAVAILIALSVAGVKFTNLAIIAGALSVGIGFGLQNIVNNFVSGLILLFERPVKTGDWIMVGNTEGYVKRIRIRSTQIQTFDRADVIVPNSELISGQVTNWMLYDPRGRIRVPIGIAYGSDTQQVKDILLRIATEHPQVITDGTVPDPKVLFINFGDSSLNFELRAFIQNIDERLQVASDINFAIDAAFREAGIEIPFPQRDLHFRNSPPATGD
jgi:small-conductance mechanosensitive channel